MNGYGNADIPDMKALETLPVSYFALINPEYNVPEKSIWKESTKEVCHISIEKSLFLCSKEQLGFNVEMDK